MILRQLYEEDRILHKLWKEKIWQIMNSLNNYCTEFVILVVMVYITLSCMYNIDSHGFQISLRFQDITLLEISERKNSSKEGKIISTFLVVFLLSNLPG